MKTIRPLSQHERLPSEQIQDQQMIELAQAGQLLPAIRLYRAKYGVGLAEGKVGVEGLVKALEPSQ